MTMLLACASGVRAEALRSYDARTDRLQSLDKDELARLDGLLARGPVALVEVTAGDADQLSAIDVAVRVRAPARVLESVVTDPARYPRFMPALDAVKVVERRPSTIVYDWSFDLAALSLTGRNVMTVFSAGAARPGATTRVTIDTLSGDLGRGRYLMRIVPQGADQSLLVLSLRLDLRQGSYVLRQLASHSRSVNRSANLALGVSMALHLEQEAEARFHGKLAATAAAPLARPNFDAKLLAPLLARGDLLSFDMQGDRLAQIAVAGVVRAKSHAVRSVLRDARGFGAALLPGSSARVVPQPNDAASAATTIDWSVNVPMVGLSGRMRMHEADSIVSIDATRGSLRGGRWSFQLTRLSKRKTLVTGWASFDFRNSNWLLEKLVASDQDLGHGLTAASELMLLRSLRALSTHTQH